MASIGIYYEEEPTVKEWVKDTLPSNDDIVRHIFTVFPFLTWLRRYNLQWLVGDVVSGITVGAILVPQSMAYANLAGLPPQFGLFSAFIGGVTYWLFGTSKDISIGPIAVMSLFVSTTVQSLQEDHPEWQAHVIASALALMAGTISGIIGLLRLGWIIDFVSHTAISAFTTGAAITIAVNQLPLLLGIKGVKGSTPYATVIGCFKKIKHVKLDAAVGLTSLFILYALRFAIEAIAKRKTSARRTWFFLSSLRSVFVILLFTLVGFLVNRRHKQHPSFRVVGHVPTGFGDIGIPIISGELVSKLIGFVPVTVILLVLEHVACAKSFGRVNDYTIDPSQEILGIGIANVIGSFFGAFPATGSFSRTAVNAKAGVRTPLGGAVASIFVIMAVYALPAMFFYIPQASLAAVIIHAVGDLITPPSAIKQFWKISPIEVVLFFVSIIIMIFLSIEDGIYAAIVSSLAILLIRLARSNGTILGYVDVSPILGQYLPQKRDNSQTDMPFESLSSQSLLKKFDRDIPSKVQTDRSVFIPMNHSDGSNADVAIQHPHPGVFVFRMTEGFTYPNANLCTVKLIDTVYQNTKQTETTEQKPGDINWNQVESFNKQNKKAVSNLPTLKAIIIDFSAVNNVDITSVHALVDAREVLDRYAAPNKVQWHFAHIYNRWTKRALISVGFGRPTVLDQSSTELTERPMFNITYLDSGAEDEEMSEKKPLVTKTQKAILDFNASAVQNSPNLDHEPGRGVVEQQSSQGPRAVFGMNLPFFHIDVLSALQNVVHSLGATQDTVPENAV